MSRNIEYLIENSIKTRNIIDFVFNVSIAHGIFPPENVLKKFGAGYGPDNYISTKEQLKQYKISTEKELFVLKNKTEVDFENITNEIEKEYTKAKWKYHNCLIEYQTGLEKLNYMIVELNKCKVNNQTQDKFKTMIENYIIYLKHQLDEKFKPILIKPQKETLEQAIDRHTTLKIEELTERLESLNMQLLFDDTFFLELINTWFTK